MRIVMLLLAVLSLLLSACGDDSKMTFIRGPKDEGIDQKLFQLETLRLQRDMLETARLRLWTDRRDVSVVVTPGRRR